MTVYEGSLTSVRGWRGPARLRVHGCERCQPPVGRALTIMTAHLLVRLLLLNLNRTRPPQQHTGAGARLSEPDTKATPYKWLSNPLISLG